MIQEVTLFPWETYWVAYCAFILFVFAMLAADLGLFNRKDHVFTFKESLGWSIVWVSLALVFNWGLYHYAVSLYGLEVGKKVGMEFLTGFVIEKALAVDNLFIFVVVFTFFGIPRQFQHRILFYGILGALFFRALFIAAGAMLMQYQWVLIVFGVFLILTGIKMVVKSEQEMDPSKNFVLKYLQKHLPLRHEIQSGKFWIKENGKWFATPLFLALIVVEMTDIIFAIDSVPAIFAITNEPFIVFTSNIFAIMGLRSLYFMLAGVLHKFHLLKYGLAAVLIFVGLKMVYLNKLFGGHFPIGLSLGIILSCISASIIASLLIPEKKEAPKA